jgi:hypothetical protein
MKTLVALILGVFSFTSIYAQNYSRVKVFGDNEDLNRLGELGVTVDHGMRKEGMYFISDFSKDEIDIMNKYGFDHEILIKEELGINKEDLQGSAMEAAITSFLLFSIGAIIPVIPFFFLVVDLSIVASFDVIRDQNIHTIEKNLFEFID